MSEGPERPDLALVIVIMLVIALCSGGLKLFAMLLRSLPLRHRFPQQILDLPVHTAQFISRPFFQVFPERRREPEQKRFAFIRGHPQEYNVPVLTTGLTSASPQRTTNRLLTMAALRSSSISTTSFAVSSFSAMSTILTAP
jgi:hypothetical protein